MTRLVACWIAGLLAAVSATADAAPPLEVYGNLPGFEDAAIAPSGTHYAVVGVVGEHRNLVVLNLDETPRLLMPVGDSKISRIEFVDDDRLLLWLRTTQKLDADFVEDQIETSSAIVVDIVKRSAIVVLKKPFIFGGIANYFGAARVDGRLYGYFSAITIGRDSAGGGIWDGNRPDLYQVDLLTGEANVIGRQATGMLRRDWLVNADGKVAAMLESSAAAGRWSLRGADREIERGSSPVSIGLAALGTTPGNIIHYRDAGSGIECCFEIGTGPAKRLFEGVSVSAVLVDPLTRQLAGYVSEADFPQTRFLDARRDSRMRSAVKAFPGSHVELVDNSADFERLIIRTTGPGDAGTWWLIDMRKGSAVDIGRAYPGVKPADVGPVTVFKWKATDGLALEGVLTTPPGRTPKNLPLVVLPHGGPAARDYPVFDWWAQALAAQGYAVFQPNFRGSSGYGHALRKAGEGEWGGKMIGDIADGIAALAKQGLVDAKRACIVGASYGGYAALAGVTVQQGLYRCAVAVAPVSDLASFFATTTRRSDEGRLIARHWKKMVGTTALSTISPAARAAEADAPVLLIHGTGDTVVPFQQSELMRARLARAGKPVELLTLAGEDHWLSRSKTRLAMLRATVAFVLRHNPPG